MSNRIEDALNSKVSLYETAYAAAKMPAKRQVWLLVHAEDKTASDYCGMILNYPGIKPGVRIITFKSGIELENFLDDISIQAEEGRNPILNRQYFLYVASDLKNVLDVDFESFRSSFNQFEYDLLYITKSKKNKPEEKKRFMRCMTTLSRDSRSGRVLVLDALSSERPGNRISPKDLGFHNEDAWYRISTSEYSSIREGICEHIYRQLKPQLMEEQEEKIVRKLCETEQNFAFFVNALCGSRRVFPLARELPMTGFYALQAALGGIGGKKLKQPAGTGRNIENILSMLYGAENGSCNPERLRERLINGIIPEICRSAVREMNNTLTGSLFSKFTLRDIFEPSGIAARISAQKNEYDRLVEKQNKNLVQYIQYTEFVTEGFDPETICRNLKTYFDEWDRCISLCIWREWWGAYADFLAELTRKNMEEFNTLIEACYMLEMEIDHKNIHLDARGTVTCVNDVIYEIDHFSNIKPYSADDLKKVMQRETNLVIGTEGDMGDARLKPRIFLLGDSKALKREFRESRDIEWLVRPAVYVPQSSAYAVRFYELPTAEVEQ